MSEKKMSPSVKRLIKKRLDTIAAKTKELEEIIKNYYPEGFVYFEPESGVFAVKRMHKDSVDMHDVIIAGSESEHSFDAGGW